MFLTKNNITLLHIIDDCGELIIWVGLWHYPI